MVSPREGGEQQFLTEPGRRKWRLPPSPLTKLVNLVPRCCSRAHPLGPPPEPVPAQTRSSGRGRPGPFPPEPGPEPSCWRRRPVSKLWMPPYQDTQSPAAGGPPPAAPRHLSAQLRLCSVRISATRTSGSISWGNMLMAASTQWALKMPSSFFLRASLSFRPPGGSA